MNDLPKKKNIKRDLLSAFKHVPGLLEISPSVLGNEKTRDPICKGFGILIFDNIDHARRCVWNHEFYISLAIRNVFKVSYVMYKAMLLLCSFSI